MDSKHYNNHFYSTEKSHRSFFQSVLFEFLLVATDNELITRDFKYEQKFKTI